jgi:PTH1 family peptidyl-tRNA hydrolase
LADSWLVAGLGNPGDRYATTRHNAGAMVAERLAERWDVRLRKVRFLAVNAAEARHDDTALLLVTPTTFMNVCGPPIASFARKRAVPVDRIVVCHDDIDLAFGALRIKRGGSTAGHHGLDSLVQALRTPDFYRVRVGIGRPSSGRWQNVDFLLEPFAKREREDVPVLVEGAADAVLSLVTDGLAATQDRFSRPGLGRPSPSGRRPPAG